MTTAKKRLGTNRYNPGVYYDATDGATRAQFEDVGEFAKSIVVEDGFIECPDSVNSSIIVVNLSGKNKSISCCKDQKTKNDLPAYRENQEELDCFDLPAGESTHIVCPPSNWTLSIERTVQDDDGSVKQLSVLGKDLRHIRNKVFTLLPGQATGNFRVAETTSEINNYTVVKNKTPEHIILILSKANTSYPRSPAEIQRLKVSRLPDKGNKIVEQVLIPPDGEYHYYHHPGAYVIRALETDPCLKPSFGKVIFPSMTNYVEDAETVAYCGQTVVILKTEDNDGSVEAVAYDTSDLKLVEGRIAVSLHQQV